VKDFRHRNRRRLDIGRDQQIEKERKKERKKERIIQR
jgi:hypothetical protein